MFINRFFLILEAQRVLGYHQTPILYASRINKKTITFEGFSYINRLAILNQVTTLKWTIMHDQILFFY